MRRLDCCIGVVDYITIAPDNVENQQEDLSTCKKIHFRNSLRPLPLLVVKHWNEQMRMEMKVRTKITESQTLYKLKESFDYYICCKLDPLLFTIFNIKGNMNKSQCQFMP